MEQNICKKPSYEKAQWHEIFYQCTGDDTEAEASPCLYLLEDRICSINLIFLALIVCSIEEIMGNELWQPNVGNPVSSLQNQICDKSGLMLYDVF